MQGTPSRSLACSYFTLSIKAKFLAYPPEFVLVLFVFAKYRREEDIDFS